MSSLQEKVAVKEEVDEKHYTVKVDVNAPEMAMLPGGCFVMSIPLKSKVVNKPVAMGWALMAVFRVYELYNDFERLQREHQARVKKGDLSMLGKLKEFAGFSS